ncbi:ABC transporter permease subunit/CPBP intramembrane protease [Chondromyces crocatus]|uniref:ABC transporter sodium permease n=1 Tax=Chondromyces crocatus TaxID=52 RepID=A0A0K1EAP9_CHOCO|nr:ABC transporter permease subunit/CPBP intramembrane protease [Chondromyces crocatus]AKT37638.1 ABC transporter sodium permease [Chondromyces crocatus]
MLRFSIVWTILCKELQETLRDRRTLFRLILLPVILYPIFAIGISKLLGSESAARAARPSVVAVWGRLPASFEQTLKETKRIEIQPWAGIPEALRRDFAEKTLEPPPYPDAAEREEDEEAEATSKIATQWTEPDNEVLLAARAALSRHEVDVVVVAWSDFAPAVEQNRQGQVSIYFDSVRPDSTTARNRLDAAVTRARKVIREEREVRAGVPSGFSTPIELLFRNAAPERRRVGQILGSMMPMMLILMSLLGAFLPAIDLTAGEKERGTMQTLLCAPVRPLEIIWGKFLAVWCIAVLTALANVISLAFTVRRLLPTVEHVAPSVFLLTFVLLVPVTFLFSALFLALAVFARDFKDGQNALMPATLPLTLLAGVASLPIVELNPWTALVPVLNIALLIKALFLGDVTSQLIFWSLFSSTIYAALSLLLAARIFGREQVLLGGREGARELLGLERRDGGEPSAAFSLTSLGIILVVAYYGSLAVMQLGIAGQLLSTQLGMFLLPTLLLVLGFGYSARETFALRLPPLGGLLGAFLVGISGWVVIAGLVVRFLPPPDELARELSKAILLDGAPLWWVLLLTAVMPAVCEELLFRGLLYSGLRRFGPALAIGVSSLLFGLAHGSVFRLLPTLLLGVGMGYARYRTGSIAAGMLIHMLNNGIAASLLYFMPEMVEASEDVPWSATAVGVAVYMAGIALLQGSRTEEPKASVPAV